MTNLYQTDWLSPHEELPPKGLVVYNRLTQDRGVLVPVEDETLNTLAKSLDDGYEWEQLIPRLMNLPPKTVLYVDEGFGCMKQVWPLEVSDDS